MRDPNRPSHSAFVTSRLEAKKARLERALSDVDAALEALRSNPEAARLQDLINRAYASMIMTDKPEVGDI